MTISTRNSMALTAVGLILSGCSTLAPTYQQPKAPVPQQWASAGQAAAGEAVKTIAELPWREFVVESRLQKVIELALANNRDLRVATLNIDRARALYQIQRAPQLPQVNATAGATGQRTPADLSSTGKARVSHQYNVGLSASYELDFWGRVSNLKDQALEQYLATEQAQRSVQISLISDVATAWLNLAADRERLQLAQETLKSQQESYQLMQRRFDLGALSELDLRQAQSRVEAARVDVALYTAQEALSENALNLLVGAAVPKELAPDKLGEVTVLRELSAGLSSEILLKRPDISAAEHRLKGMNANIGAARAGYFPKISLTAGLGTASSQLSGLFQGGSGVWSIMPQVSLPIFDWGAVKSGVEVAKADQKIALAQYEKAIQTAFREVADALTNYQTLGDRLTAQQAFSDAVGESYRISEARYQKGVDSYLTVLDAQRSTYSAKQGLISTRLARYSNRISLYKVLGGGGPE